MNFFYNPLNNENKSQNQDNKQQNFGAENQIHMHQTTDFNTLQKARKDLIGEVQAVIDYDEHIHTTNDRLAKATWEDIKKEELIHVGELLALLNYLDPSQEMYVNKGIEEFIEMMKNQ